MNISKQIRWDCKNPVELQKFIVGDSFYYKGEVFRLCHVTGLAGINSETENGHFFVIDDTGSAHCVKNTLEEVLNHYANNDILIKVIVTGFEEGYVVYSPTY